VTTTNPPRTTRRGEDREKRFLGAARDVFYESGFEAASVNEIVRRAGDSLATLYAQFDSKKGLFLALVDDGVAAMRADLAAAEGPLEDALGTLARNYLDGVMAPGAIGTFRILVGEGRNFPDIAQTFFERGPKKLRQDMSAFLAERAALGEIDCADTDFAAQAFFDMLRSHHRVRRAAHIDNSETDLGPHIDKVVTLFLRGVAPRRDV
jgi:AcrR family transcriptional regulator